MADGTRTPLSAGTSTGSGLATPRAQAGAADLAVQRARRYIETHLGDTPTMSDIARAACMSRFHLARRFRSCTGNSPMRYLAQLRIDRARELLLQPQRSLSDIAAELGFFDQSHFTRSFRRATGVTPGAYARARAPSCEARSACPQAPSFPPRHRPHEEPRHDHRDPRRRAHAAHAC